MSLDKDGYLLTKNFIDISYLNNLLSKIDKIFLSNHNIPNGYTIVQRKKGKYKLNINFPCISILDPNLLEKSLDVMGCIKKNFHSNYYDLQNYNLTNLEIEESKQDNLFWHTDNRKGMLRCFLFLRGGQEGSGALRYMKGSHIRNYEVEHKLSNKQLDQNKNYITDLFCEPGDLVVIDTYGFHANFKQKKNRSVVLFEFQHKDSNFPKSDIFFSSQLLTNKIMENIEFFQPKVSEELHGANQKINSLPSHINPKGVIKPLMRYIYNKYFF